MEVFSWVIVAALIAYLVYTKVTQNKTDRGDPEQAVDQSNYSGCYIRKFLFSKNEYYNAKNLYKYAAERGLILCPKVRLLDIIEPVKGERYQSLLGKIKSKHVDFVVCDRDLRVLGVIELDDNSHDRADRQVRDQFVDSVLLDVGYKVVRVRGVTEATLDAFMDTAQDRAKQE